MSTVSKVPHAEVEEEEGDNDAAAQVDENVGGDIEDDFVIEYDVRIDLDVRILGVKIGIDENTDRDEMVDVDVKNKVDAWVGVVELAVHVVIETLAGVRSEGGHVGAQDAIAGAPAGVAVFVVEWAVVDVAAQTEAVGALGSGAMADHSYVVVEKVEWAV